MLEQATNCTSHITLGLVALAASGPLTLMCLLKIYQKLSPTRVLGQTPGKLLTSKEGAVPDTRIMLCYRFYLVTMTILHLWSIKAMGKPPFSDPPTLTPRAAAEGSKRGIVKGSVGASLGLMSNNTSYADLVASLRQAYAAATHPFSDASKNTCNSLDPTSSFSLSVRLCILITPKFLLNLTQPSQAATSCGLTQAEDTSARFLRNCLLGSHDGAPGPDKSNREDVSERLPRLIFILSAGSRRNVNLSLILSHDPHSALGSVAPADGNGTATFLEMLLIILRSWRSVF